MERLRPGDPESIGPYSLIARLGSGGMGIVFLGSRGAELAAIKVVRNTFLDDPSLRTRFEREVATLRKIDSTRIARFIDADLDDDIAWHASEFVDGLTLKKHVQSLGPLDRPSWWDFTEQLREALSDLHRLGIVHRDLKPSNIVLSPNGMKLIDFGIAVDSEATSVTVTGGLAGSPAWLAPEHLKGLPLTSSADYFSAGSVLFYAGTGQSPWGDEKELEVAAIYERISKFKGFPDSVDGGQLQKLDQRQRSVIRSLLEPDPVRRSFPQPPAEKPQPQPTHSGSLRGALLAGALVTVGLLSGVAVWSSSQVASDSAAGNGAGVNFSSETDYQLSSPYDLRGATFTLGSRNSDDQLVLTSMIAQLLDAAGAEVEGIPNAGSTQVRDWLEADLISAYPEFDIVGWRAVSESSVTEGQQVDLLALDREDRAENNIAWVGESNLTNKSGRTQYFSVRADLADRHSAALEGIISDLFGRLSSADLAELADTVSGDNHWDVAGGYLVKEGLIRTVPPMVNPGKPSYGGDLRVGDCYIPVEDVVEGEPDIYLIACDLPHIYEMFARVTLENGPYPGDDAVIERSQERCEAEFDDFVGTPYFSSTLWTFGLWPDRNLWETGDRDAFCIIHDWDQYVSGSLEGARR